MAAQTKTEIDALRANYELQIRHHESEIVALKNKIQRLNEFEADRATLLSVPPNKYADMGLRDAALDAVKTMHEIGSAGADGVTARDVAFFMMHHGFVEARRKKYFDESSARKKRKMISSAELGADEKGRFVFIPAVHITLDRLASDLKSGIVVARIQNRKFFKPRNI